MALGWYGLIMAVIAAVSLTVMLIADRRAKRRVLELELARQAGDLDARWENWQQARSGRHRVGQPRTVAALGMPPGAGRDPHPKPSAPDLRHVTASDLGPVVLVPATSESVAAAIMDSAATILAGPQAAPSKHDAPDTSRMPRIQLETATTGEIRAVGDRIVAAIEAGEPLT